jgi:NFU1 iron-sulfur cluster scaffold homolog, mitochondrial
MSDAATRRRIRAQASAVDADVMAFLLDEAVQPGRSGGFTQEATRRLRVRSLR